MTWVRRAVSESAYLREIGEIYTVNDIHINTDKYIKNMELLCRIYMVGYDFSDDEYHEILDTLRFLDNDRYFDILLIMKSKGIIPSQRYLHEYNKIITKDTLYLTALFYKRYNLIQYIDGKENEPEVTSSRFDRNNHFNRNNDFNRNALFNRRDEFAESDEYNRNDEFIHPMSEGISRINRHTKPNLRQVYRNPRMLRSSSNESSQSNSETIIGRSIEKFRSFRLFNLNNDALETAYSENNILMLNQILKSGEDIKERTSIFLKCIDDDKYEFLEVILSNITGIKYYKLLLHSLKNAKFLELILKYLPEKFSQSLSATSVFEIIDQQLKIGNIETLNLLFLSNMIADKTYAVYNFARGARVSKNYDTLNYILCYYKLSLVEIKAEMVQIITTRDTNCLEVYVTYCDVAEVFDQIPNMLFLIYPNGFILTDDFLDFLNFVLSSKLLSVEVIKKIMVCTSDEPDVIDLILSHEYVLD